MSSFKYMGNQHELIFIGQSFLSIWFYWDWYKKCNWVWRCTWM